MVELNERDLEKLILIGDKVLIKPNKPPQKTDSGLYLPQGLHKKEELFTGYVMRVGPGYPIPAMRDPDEAWKEQADGGHYVPLQPVPGDLAIYLQKSVFDIVFNKKPYVIVPHNAIMMVVRDNDLI